MEVSPIAGSGVVLGRGEDCSLRLEAGGVSTNHCRLEPTEEGVLHVVDLESLNGTFINGWRIPAQGAGCRPESILRVGEALFIYRELSAAEAEAARLPPLSGPVHTRHPPLVQAVERIEEYRTTGGPIWLCGPGGCGRSVLKKHLERLAEEAVWMMETESSKVVLDVRYFDTAPPEALEPRVVVFPALRDRIEDLGLLIRSLCAPRKINFTSRLLEALHLYDWTGNVRELRIMLERALHPVWACMPGVPWDLEQFPDVARYLELRPRPRSSPIPRGPVLIDDEPHPTLPPMNSTELRQHMEASLWKLFDAADSLSLDRATLINALAAAGIRGPAQGLPGADTGQAPPGL